MNKMDIKYYKSSEKGQIGDPCWGGTSRADEIWGGRMKTEGGIKWRV